MPANLTPEFRKARDRFNRAKTPEEKLAALEEMLATIPKHKGTYKMQGDIRKKIARYRSMESTSKKSGRGSGVDHIPKEGAGQGVLIGSPNAGKSSLLSALTNARPDVAEYPFSTILPVPGMMAFEDIAIQLIDLPPISPEYTESWVYSLIRAADFGFLVLDATDGDLLEDEVLEIASQLAEHHIELVEESEETADDRVRLLPTRIVLTKVDAVGSAREIETIDLPVVSVSVADGAGLDEVRRVAFETLRIVRVYTKLPGKKPDMTEPYSLPIGSTAIDVVKAVHREFVERLKYVRVWGSGRFDGQQVPSDHVLKDGDVVEIHLQ